MNLHLSSPRTCHDIVYWVRAFERVKESKSGSGFASCVLRGSPPTRRAPQDEERGLVPNITQVISRLLENPKLLILRSERFARASKDALAAVQDIFHALARGHDSGRCESPTRPGAGARAPAGVTMAGIAVASLLASLALPAAAADEGRVAYGDSAGITAALSALGLECKTSAARDTSCTAMGKDGGIMAVTMNSAGMLSVLFAGRGVDSPSVAEAYRAAADRLPFGDGSLLDRFADPPAIVAFCKDAGHVGVGDDAKWCDATVVFSSAGDAVVQNLTQEVLQALGSAEGVDRATVNAAVDQAPLEEGLFVAVQDSTEAPRMSAIAWLPTERFASNAE